MSNMLYWRLAQPLYTYLSVRFVCYRPLAPMIRYLHKDKTGPDSEFKKRLRQRLHKAIEAKVDNLKEKQRASTSGTPADSASASKKDVKKVNPPPSIKVIDNSKNLYGIEYPSQMYKDSQPPPETSPATLKKSNEKDVGLNTDKPTFESRAKAFVESSIIKEQESKGTPDKSRNDENKKNSQKNNPNNSASTSTSVDWTKISPNQDPLKEKIIKQNKTDLKKLTAATKRLESQKEFKRKDNKTLIESKPQTPRDGLFKHNADPYKTKLHEKSYEKPPTAQSMKSGYGPISKSKPIVNRIEQLSQAEAEAEAKAAIANTKMKTEAKAGMKAEQVAKAKSEVKAEVKAGIKAESKAQAAAKVQAKADPAKGETISQANVSTSNETKSGKRQTNNSAGVAQDPKNASSNIKITDRRNTAVESGSVETGSQNKKVNTKGTSESESEQSDIICDAEGNKMFVGGSVNKLSRGGNESPKNKQKRLSFKTLQFKTKNYLVENRYSKKKAISPKVEKSLFTSKPTQSHMGMKLKTSIKYEMDAKRNTKSLNKDKDDLSKWKDFQSGLSNLDVSTKSEKKIMSPKVEKNLFTNKPTQSQLKIKASPEINSERDRKGGLNKDKDGLSKSKVSQSGLSNMGVSTKSEKEIMSPKVEKSLFTNKPTQSQLETKVNPEIKSERDPKGSLNKDKDDLSKSKVCHRGLSNMGVSTKSEKEITSPKVEKNLFTNKPTQSRLETKVNPEIKSERDLKGSLNKVNDDLSKSKVSQSGLSNMGVSTKSEKEIMSPKVEKNLFTNKPTQSQLETKVNPEIKSERDLKESLNKVNDDLSKSNVFQSGLSNTNLSVKSERGTTSSKVKKNIFENKPTQSQIETKLKTAIGKIKSEMDTNDSKGASCDKTKATNSKTQQNKVGSTSNIEKWLSRARELKAHQQQQFSKKKSPVDIIRKAFNAKYPPISPAKGTKSTDTKGSKSNTPPPVKDSFESLDPMISSPTLGNKICDNTVKPGEIHLVASGNIVINTAQTQLNPLLTPDSINADLNKKDSSLNKPGTNDRKPKTSQVVKPKFGFTVPLNLEAADEIPNNKNNPVESLLQNELKNPLISKENNFKENQITIAEIIKKLSQTSKSKADSIRSLNESRKSREQLEPVKGNPTKTSPTGTTNDKFSKKPVSEKTSDQILSRSITSDTIVSKIASESTDLDQSDFSTPSQSFGNSAEGETVASYGKTLCFASEECQISKITASADIADVGNCVSVNDILDESKTFEFKNIPIKTNRLSDYHLAPGQLHNSESEDGDRTAHMLSVQESRELSSLEGNADLDRWGKHEALMNVPPRAKDDTAEKMAELKDEETQSQPEKCSMLYSKAKDEARRRVTVLQYLCQLFKGKRNGNNDSGLRNITTSAVHSRNKDVDDYRASNQIYKKFLSKPKKTFKNDTFVSPNVRKHGMGSQILRGQRKKVEKPSTNKGNDSNRTKKATVHISSDTNRKLPTKPSPEQVIKSHEKIELRKNLDNLADTANIPDDSPIKSEEESPTVKMNSKKGISDIQIQGGSKYVLRKLKASRGMRKDGERDEPKEIK